MLVVFEILIEVLFLDFMVRRSLAEVDSLIDVNHQSLIVQALPLTKEAWARLSKFFFVLFFWSFENHQTLVPLH